MRYTNLRVIFMGVFTRPTKMKKGNEKMKNGLLHMAAECRIVHQTLKH